ncbi:hypothetical protein BT96DRAFT_1038174 [Gymnopus androsaceus JB14]|uniref:Uncharacterized protein n=1 Tax=Gymnopus androsaceus JB14 TaxID=1447944 RepID=A0A6A4HH40_9AGAR|nr:hypothetical protein BT96DRAFT_1038174 [Gymnopus androsaceus JB14]
MNNFVKADVQLSPYSSLLSVLTNLSMSFFEFQIENPALANSICSPTSSIKDRQPDPIVTPVGSLAYDRNHGYSLEWNSMTEMEAWLNEEEESRLVEYVVKEKPSPTTNNWLTKTVYVCGRQLSGRKKNYLKKHTWSRKVECKKTGCSSRLIMKTYPGTSTILGHYKVEHSHPLGVKMPVIHMIEAETIRLASQDGMSVLKWVKDLRSQGHFVHLKTKSDPVPQGTQIEKDSFILIVQTRYQKECWQKWADNRLACIDATHNTIHYSGMRTSEVMHFVTLHYLELWELLKKWIRVAIKAEFDAYWEKIKLLAPPSLIVYFEKHWLNTPGLLSIDKTRTSLFYVTQICLLKCVNLEVKEHNAIEKRAESIPASAITPEKLEDGTQSPTAFNVQSQSDSELSHVIEELEHFDKTFLPPRKKVAPNQGSWRETADVIGVEVKGSKKRKHTDAYAGGEQSGSSAKPDAKVSLRSKVTKISQAVPVQLLQIPATAVPSVPQTFNISISMTQQHSAAFCMQP